MPNNTPTPWDLLLRIMTEVKREDMPYLDRRLLQDYMKRILADEEPSEYELSTAKKWGFVNVK